MKKNEIIKNWRKEEEEMYGTPTNKINIFENEMRKMIKIQAEEKIRKRIIGGINDIKII